MIRVKTVLRHENINKIRARIDGVATNLNAISQINLRIPSLGVDISDTTPDDYPLKWVHSPEDVGLIELQLGEQQSILDNFIISTTGDTTSGSAIIENIPATIIDKLSRFMLVELGLTGITPEIINVDRENNTITLSENATATASSVSLLIYEYLKSTIHKARFYIFNVKFPNGIFWNEIELDIGF
jgi:hypothetical protein